MKYDYVAFYGNSRDGVIEIPFLTEDCNIVEGGLYYGEKKKKPILSISTQIGCPSKCLFCTYSDSRYKRDLSALEMEQQVSHLWSQGVRNNVSFDNGFKVSTGKCGEPLYNGSLVEAMNKIHSLGATFKISTIFPNYKKCYLTLEDIAEFAALHPQEVQMQISLHSTDEAYRRNITGMNVASLSSIAEFGEYWKKTVIGGRKINLSLVMTNKTPLDAKVAIDVFNPDLFRFRIRPIIEEDDVKVITTGVASAFFDRDLRIAGFETTLDGIPTPTECRFKLAAGVTQRRYEHMRFGKSIN